jgi:hypothetical protein
MPAFPKIPTVLVGRRPGMVLAAATRARGASYALRARAEQCIIESECCATKLALIQDMKAWRIHQRTRDKPAEPYTPYLT